MLDKKYLFNVSCFFKNKVNNNVYLYMVGRDINYANKELCSYINNLKINKKIFF